MFQIGIDVGGTVTDCVPVIYSVIQPAIHQNAGNINAVGMDWKSSFGVSRAESGWECCVSANPGMPWGRPGPKRAGEALCARLVRGTVVRAHQSTDLGLPVPRSARATGRGDD